MTNTVTNWSLEELYPSFESPCFKEDFDETLNAIKQLKHFAEAELSFEASAEALAQYISLLTGFYNKAMRLCDFCQLSLSTEAENIRALNLLEKLEDALTDITLPETKFSMLIKGTDDDKLKKIINGGQEIIKEHEFYLREIKRRSRYLLSEAEETVLSKMETTGSSAWEKYQENVMSTLTVLIDIDGEHKKLPFAEVRNLAYSNDAKIRKEAFYAELSACKSVSKACAAALNGIKGEALTVSRLRGYNSPLEMSVLDSRLDMEILKALVTSIRKNSPAFIPYFNKKAEILGKHKLPFYDLFAPIGKDMSFTFDEAVNFVYESFCDFSPALGEYAMRAAKSGWIDVYPKEGKRGGAFCQNLHYLKQSRFLLNFKGSFNDVLTLAHELGHGYHGECLLGESLLNSEYPMPIAETASTLCETIVVNAALKNAAGSEALAILENGISGNAQVIVDILSRFIFESALFERRKEGSLSVEEICNLMRDAQTEAYGNGLDCDALHEYMWVVKPHYYSASVNFYNFPYAFGQLFSNGLYSLFLKNGADFANVYTEMLASTGKMNLKDVALIAGLDIRDSNFWDRSFDVIRTDIERFTNHDAQCVHK